MFSFVDSDKDGRELRCHRKKAWNQCSELMGFGVFFFFFFFIQKKGAMMRAENYHSPLSSPQVSLATWSRKRVPRSKETKLVRAGLS